jgi:signal transduction histidine kinase
MSLMCHEVRTPLNGCLASAEMLLDTPLKVRRGGGGSGEEACLAAVEEV